jgi:hypothetical protein
MQAYSASVTKLYACAERKGKRKGGEREGKTRAVGEAVGAAAKGKSQ